MHQKNKLLSMHIQIIYFNSNNIFHIPSISFYASEKQIGIQIQSRRSKVPISKVGFGSMFCTEEIRYVPIPNFLASFIFS